VVNLESQKQVLHQGLNPNPLEVILTAKTLSCRYRKAYAGPYHPTKELRTAKSGYLTPARQYQLIIKLAEARRTKSQRGAYAFVAVICRSGSVFRG